MMRLRTRSKSVIKNAVPLQPFTEIRDELRRSKPGAVNDCYDGCPRFV